MTDREFTSRAVAFGRSMRRAADTYKLPRAAEKDFLRQLGRRLHERRMLLDMPRCELARRSGISERYLAQIEAGKGNVSIVLLLRIIQAVRMP